MFKKRILCAGNYGVSWEIKDEHGDPSSISTNIEYNIHIHILSFYLKGNDLICYYGLRLIFSQVASMKA